MLGIPLELFYLFFTNFGMLYYHLYAFKISVQTPSLTHRLFRNVLFSFQVIRHFPYYPSVTPTLFHCGEKIHSYNLGILNEWRWFILWQRMYSTLYVL